VLGAEFQTKCWKLFSLQFHLWHQTLFKIELGFGTCEPVKPDKDA